MREGKRIGVIVGEQSDDFSRKGAAVRDIIVDPLLWQQGIGWRLHRLLYNHLAREAYTFIHGYIDAANVASQKTARKAGRIPLFDGYMFSDNLELAPPV